MATLNVKTQYLEMLIEIFKSYCPYAEIWAYGSRTNGKSHDGSDLDLVVKNFNSKDCNITELKEVINNSNIPFLIDIQDYNLLPDYFKNEIQKNYIVIFGSKD